MQKSKFDYAGAILAACGKRRVTQTELARRLGESRQMVNNHIKDKARNLGFLERVADVLDMPLSELVKFGE